MGNVHFASWGAEDMEGKKKILVIEDDLSVSEVVGHHLSSHGFDVDQEHDGPSGLTKALEQDYSLVILDLNLPRMSGLDICKAIRKKKEFLPLIMLTARGGEMDKVVGLEVGADDYLVKPFSVPELIARVRARLRIAPSSATSEESEQNSEPLVCGTFLLDPDKRIATLNGVNLDLTLKEFDVVEHLLRNRHRAVSRDELLRVVWGSTVSAYTDAVTTCIGRLRKKLERISPDANYVLIVRGIGYRFVDPSDPSEPPSLDDEQ